MNPAAQTQLAARLFAAAATGDEKAVSTIISGVLEYVGPLMGDPQCHMSIFLNGNVTRPCRLFSLMSHVKYNYVKYHYNF